MTDRILDISENPASLSVRRGQLQIDTEAGRASVPLADLAALVVSHPRATYTQAVLAGLVEAGGAFVVCDERRLPVGLLLPLDAHYVQTERITRQAALPLPRRKRLWQQIVRAKIAAQAGLLQKLRGDDAGLAALAPLVRSGDPANVEARAAQRYWPALFADKAFRRNRKADDQNRYLNYAYAVLRATVARAVCAAGLHPSMGLHHSNRYNSFCLADDLLEVLRPLADEAAVEAWESFGSDAPLGNEVKAVLLAPLTGRLDMEGERRTLFDCLARTAQSLAQVCEGKRKDLALPTPFVVCP